MNFAQVEENLQQLVENFSQEEFIYDLLLAYGLPKNTITLLKKGNRNMAKKDGQIILKKKLFFQEVVNSDLHAVIDALRKTEETFKHDPRFIVVTDYKTLLAIDVKTADTLDIPIIEITKHYDFFLPWAGMEKAQLKSESEADVKAAEKMARLYDQILKDNPYRTYDQLHSLNVFLSRILFCFFAEDTGIFEKNAFTESIISHTQHDGSDLDLYLNRVFEIMNTQHRKDEPEYLKAFPYVNGGLFGHKYEAPKFTPKSHKWLVDCGKLNWSEINPDIFGSMIQAVVHPDQRGGMGMHYTSVPNIMKIIEPLILNDLREEFEKHHDNRAKLEHLLARLERIRVFDPACGSGNFLIIAYKELRKLEIAIYQRIGELSSSNQLPLSRIKLSQFYGIELDDFAHEVAVLSLWLAEHQMNVKFKEVFGHATPALPLKEGGYIVCKNATRISWDKVCPREDGWETYLLGNPPYLGARLQDDEQKKDVEITFKNVCEGYNNLDYIACWFYKAAEYIRNINAKFAFVSTNSICQGSQVSLLWPHVLENSLEIFFAHQSFKWTNNAKLNAAVICVIVGVRNLSKADKILYRDGIKYSADNISSYLTDSETVFIDSRRQPISSVPRMTFGSMANDGGNLILTDEEYRDLISKEPDAKNFLKSLLGAKEFINGISRWCIWVDDSKSKNPLFQNLFAERIKATRSHRLESDRKSTQDLAKVPYRFGEVRHQAGHSIIVPRVSSERRPYIPCGFLDDDTVISDSALAIYNAEAWIFGVVTSSMHMAWVRAIGGRLKTDYRYSAELCYNTFPIPMLTEKQKETITQHVYNVLGERENHSEKTLADLYDPDYMPPGLKDAHHNLDLAVERCYRSKNFSSDEERLEYLFKLYKEMTAAEQGAMPCLI
jgi:hypothetical protein